MGRGNEDRNETTDRSSRGHEDPVNVDSVRGVLMGNCFINSGKLFQNFIFTYGN